MKTITNILMALTLFAVVSCNKDEVQNIAPKQAAEQHKVQSQLTLANPRGNLHLSQLEVTKAYFDFHLFNIQIKKTIDEPAIIEPPEMHTAAFLYVYEQNSRPLPLKKALCAIITAIPDPDQLMLWNKIEIKFNPGFTEHQFYSQMQVIIASQGVHPSITLKPTGVVYVGKLFDVTKEPVSDIPPKEF